jgi:hypothetical protein
MTDISLKEAISFAFKKVRENFKLFIDLSTKVVIGIPLNIKTFYYR